MVAGGESGPGARPFNVAWARSIIEQCQVAGVPVFMKQVGAHAYDAEGVNKPSLCSHQKSGRPDSVVNDIGDTKTYPLLKLESSKGGEPPEWPADLRVREYPAAGEVQDA